MDIFDPLIDAAKFFKDEKIKMIKKIKKNYYDIVIISVQHNKIKKMGIKKIFSFGKKNFLFFDIFDLFQSKNNQWSI